MYTYFAKQSHFVAAYGYVLKDDINSDYYIAEQRYFFFDKIRPPTFSSKTLEKPLMFKKLLLMKITKEIINRYGFKKINFSMWCKGEMTLQKNLIHKVKHWQKELLILAKQVTELAIKGNI